MTTVAQLQTSIDEWLVRDDVGTGDNADQIIAIAESYIARDFRFGQQEATTTIQITDRRGDLPADFLELRNPFIDDNVRKFEYKTPQAIREAASWGDRGTKAGAFFTIEGGGDEGGAPASPDDRMQIVIAGPASTSDPIDVELLYWRRFPPLDTMTPTDTNWLLLNHFDIYLYECLRAACQTIGERDLAEYYRGLVMEIKAEQKLHENRKRYGAMPKQAYGNPRGIV